VSTFGDILVADERSVHVMEPLLARAELQDYLWPRDVDDALELLTQHAGAARLVGGGTDLALHPPAGVTALIDLSRLPMAYLSDRGGDVAIGATTTLTAMAQSPLLAGFAGGVLPSALVQVGSPALRNLATIGGHLARGRLSDLVPVLLVLDAVLRVVDGREHTVPLAEFLASPRDDQPRVITEVVLPGAGRDAAGGFVRFSRAGYDFALLNCAAALDLDGDRIVSARASVGETPALARRVVEVEEVLVGRSIGDGCIAEAAHLARRVVVTGDDQRASAGYRTQLVEVAVRRCLHAAAGEPEVAP
jgi:CO/xanthine dehydrogenase FAD-binding subunit